MDRTIINCFITTATIPPCLRSLACYQMEKYSLLKLRPTLTQTLNLSLKNRPSILRDSLYSVLNGAADGAEGQCVRVFDGQMTRDYRVIKYERYKVKKGIKFPQYSMICL